MKKVIIEFETIEQAKAFFGIFSDTPAIEDIETGEVVKDAFNIIMYHCDIDSVSTTTNESAYLIKCL